jgi:hypothetical protein
MHAQPCSAGDDPCEHPAQRGAAPNDTAPHLLIGSDTRMRRGRHVSGDRPSSDTPAAAAPEYRSRSRGELDAPLSHSYLVQRSTYEFDALRAAPAPGPSLRYEGKYQESASAPAGPPFHQVDQLVRAGQAGTVEVALFRLAGRRDIARPGDRLGDRCAAPQAPSWTTLRVGADR